MLQDHVILLLKIVLYIHSTHQKLSLTSGQTCK